MNCLYRDYINAAYSEYRPRIDCARNQFEVDFGLASANRLACQRTIDNPFERLASSWFAQRAQCKQASEHDASERASIKAIY